MNESTSALGDYLRARRDVVQPEDVGLPRDLNRRVRGLRREEVAAVAAISSDYYLRLEQGRDHQPSDQVLLAIGRALRLDGGATDYLFRLARPDVVHPFGSPAAALDEDLLRLIEQFSGTPAIIVDRNLEVAAANEMALAVGGGQLNEGMNLVALAFSPLVRRCAPQWCELALSTLASFRYHSDPLDPRRRELVRVLSRRDADFRRLWSRHDAAASFTGRTRHVINGAGMVTLRFQNLVVPGRPGHQVLTFVGEPGTPGPAALARIAAELHPLQPHTREPNAQQLLPQASHPQASHPHELSAVSR
ncbi:helix-turn-helix domain-containing protein [Subtercola endophyticus]|uniref:helix-turn-helix domain-containing protein n=1 Tax=Subtercola endophyticus TaxID=2895559 RepID=UPI001E58B612|nr:helix-turn-helix transcriptional regulator [Subtercola endophyticus]UFS57486.1 helix-turn-helix transcriptional regulator [Subtercola endophyticus]